jgi:succinoglycan biosynthesis transport protein ExoP
MTVPEEAYLPHFASALRRRWFVVLACVVVATGVALAISSHQSKKYTATAEILFQESHFEQVLFGSSSIPAPNPTRQAATNLKLVDLEVVSVHVANLLGVSSGAVREAISVAPQGEADLASVTATWGNAAFAAELANTYAERFIVLRRSAEQAQLHAAQHIVEAQIGRMSKTERSATAGQSLRERARQLRILAALQTGDAELASAASAPSEPSSPNPKRDAILGFILGLILGVGLALLIDRVDPRVRTTANAPHASPTQTESV